MKKKIILTSIIILGLFTRCVKDVSTVIYHDTPPAQGALEKLFEDAVTAEKAFMHFNSADPNFVYTTPRGTTVTINGTCLRLNGNPVTGTVILEFVELFDRALMAATNKPAMGLQSNGKKELLLSGGEFYINVKKDGVPLTTTCPVKIETPASNTGGVTTGMSAFNGFITNNELTWEPATNWDVIQVAQNKYTLNVPGFGWFNCDKFYNDPRPKTKININVPAGYNNVSRTFILVKDLPNTLGTAAGEYPVGLNCYIMFVTEQNGKYRWITKEQTLTANHSITFDIKETLTGSRADYNGHVTLLK